MQLVAIILDCSRRWSGGFMGSMFRKWRLDGWFDKPTAAQSSLFVAVPTKRVLDVCEVPQTESSGEKERNIILICLIMSWSIYFVIPSSWFDRYPKSLRLCIFGGGISTLSILYLSFWSPFPWWIASAPWTYNGGGAGWGLGVDDVTRELHRGDG